MPRILYLVSEDWYFLSHRLPMARAAREAGFEVHVATRVVDGGSAIKSEGFHLHPLDWRRGTVNPAAFIDAIAAVRRTYLTISPDLVHLVALWPSIVGSLAAIGLPMTRLAGLTGLGFVFTSNSTKARALRTLLGFFLSRLLSGPAAAVLIQNSDDLALLTKLGIAREHLFLIPGSGVDSDHLLPLPEPPGPITIGYAGRLLADKGLRSLISAQALLAARGTPVRLLIAGKTDPTNPASIPDFEVDAWRRQPGVEILGHVGDIRTLWAQAHIATLPSRREGLPKSLLEAAACGRPLIAADVPGCREVARHDENALLVPVDDVQSLADAIDKLANNANLRTRFGANSRTLVEREFGATTIGVQTVDLYRKLLR